MTKNEAIKRLGGILTEAVEFENSVCYVTEEDREPLEMAIKALEHEQALGEAFNIALLYGKEKGMEAIDKALYQMGKDGIKEQEIKALEQEPCEDAIGRQTVLDGIDVKAWEFCDYLISKGRNDEQKPVLQFADNLREYIRDELPSVKPQPKTGHWIDIDEEPHEVWECDHCGFVIDGSGCIDPYDYRDTYKFCPNCGACMKDCRTLDEFIEDSKESEEV